MTTPCPPCPVSLLPLSSTHLPTHCFCRPLLLLVCTEPAPPRIKTSRPVLPAATLDGVRLISPSKVGTVFVGRFRGKTGPLPVSGLQRCVSLMGAAGQAGRREGTGSVRSITRHMAVDGLIDCCPPPAAPAALRVCGCIGALLALPSTPTCEALPSLWLVALMLLQAAPAGMQVAGGEPGSPGVQQLLKGRRGQASKAAKGQVSCQVKQRVACCAAGCGCM
jgi:hypothetical protein